jgi:lysophospholipase L1-like esterase
LARAVAYSLRPMGNPSSRPRRSRSGLVLFLLLLILLSWEVIGRLTPVVPVTPWSFARASWAVATGGEVPGGSTAGKPDAEQLARNAYRPLPYVMYGLKPSWSRPDQKAKDGSLLVKTTNILGFRGREIEQPKPAGRYRIVCLGGSTTYSDTVGDADAYPVLLEQELKKARPGQDIEVINAGVPSYTTAETLPNLAFRCLDLQPDAIVLYEGINDFRPRVYKNFDKAYFHYRKVWNGTVDDWEAGEGEMAGGINPFIQYNVPVPNGNKLENIRKSGTDAFRRNLVSIAGIAKAHGVKVVMVSCVCDELGEFTQDEVVAGVKEHNAVVREVCAQQDVLFIDMAPRFQQAGQFADIVHMNPAGSAQMAHLIAEGLLKGLL